MESVVNKQVVLEAQPKEYQDLVDFHTKFNMLVGKTPAPLTPRLMKERIDCMAEELCELGEAVQERDMDKVVDALIDLMYFAMGTCVMLGIDFDAHWSEVQRTNMSKERGVGKRGHAVDMVKPAGWTAPNHWPILERVGYDFDYWANHDWKSYGRVHPDEEEGTR